MPLARSLGWSGTMPQAITDGLTVGPARRPHAPSEDDHLRLRNVDVEGADLGVAGRFAQSGGGCRHLGLPTLLGFARRGGGVRVRLAIEALHRAR
jgi:hypothetical protein